MMQVQVDDVWSSPGVLHLRVTVMDADGRWRHRYYPAINLDAIPVEAIAPLLAYFAENGQEQQLTLFDC